MVFFKSCLYYQCMILTNVLTLNQKNQITHFFLTLILCLRKACTEEKCPSSILYTSSYFKIKSHGGFIGETCLMLGSWKFLCLNVFLNKSKSHPDKMHLE